MINRLEYLKLNNPLLTNLKDEEILNLYHKQYYSDMDYNTFKQKVITPIENKDYNKFVLQSIKPQEELRNTENYNDGYAELVKQYPQEKIDHWKSKGAMNTWETWKNLNKLNCIPVVGASVEGFKNHKLLTIKEKIKNNIATQEDKDYFNTSMEKIAELQVRGTNIGGNIVNGVCGSVAFMGEMALVPISRGTSLVPELFKSYLTRQLNDNITITDKGEVFFTEYNKSPAMTFLKSVADVGISYSVERFGGKLIDKGFSKISSNIVKDLGATKVAKIMNKPLDWVNRNATRLLGKAGFDGVLEEYGEERLEDLIRATLNLDDKGYDIDAFKDALFPSLEDNLSELGVISILGTGGATISNTSQKLFNKLKSKNIDTNTAINVIVNTPELEKEKLLTELNNIDETKDNEAFQQKLNDFKDNFIKAGVNEVEAEALTNIHKNIITSFAENNQTNKNKLFDLLPLEVKREELKNTITSSEQMVNYINHFLSEDYKEHLKNNNKTGLTKEELLLDLKDYKNTLIEINKTKSGLSLVQYLSKHGGIYDEGGEINMYRDDVKKHAPFLLRKEETNDNSLDIQFENLREMGYFPEIKENPETYEESVNGTQLLLEAIVEEVSGGKKRYPAGENKKAELEEYMAELEQDLYEKGIDLSDLEYLEQLEKNSKEKQYKKEEILKQSSYKAPETDIKDFVNKVNTWLDNNQKIEKQSYFIINKANDIKIDTDTIRHTRDHKLTPEEWEDIGNSLDIKNVINYKFSKRYNRYGNKSIILEIKGNLNTYGVVLTNSNFNYVETAFRKDNTNLWDEWWKKSKYDIYNSEDNKERASGSFHTLSDNSKVITSIADIIIQAKNLFVNKNQTLFQNTTNIDNENFKNWFGDSKVVDKNGEPLVVYHGSPNTEIEAFEKGHFNYLIDKTADAEKGFYFTNKSKVANTYSTGIYTRLNNPRAKEGKIYKVYLSIQNPLIIDYKKQIYNEKQNLKYIKQAKKNKNDGVILKNIRDAVDVEERIPVSTSYIVFNPNQIKSVENNGEFSTNDNNIYHQSSTLPRGQISLTDTKAVITLFETSDASTVIHEMGHYYMRFTELLAKNGDTKAREQIKEINTWINKEIKRNNYKTNEEYEISKQEYFARSFEAYLRRGIAPTKELKNIFERFREWLVDVYKSVKGLNVNLTPEVIDFFNRFVVSNKLLDDIDNNSKTNQLFKEYQKLQEEIYNKREELISTNSEEYKIEITLQQEYGERLNNLEKELTLYQNIDNNIENTEKINNTINERLEKIKTEIQKGLEHRPTTLNDDFYINLINYTNQENEINNRLTNKAGRYIKNFGKYIKDFSRDTLASADEVINNIDPSLATKLKRMQTDIILMTDENKKKALPFFKTLEHIKKTNQNDYIMLDFALKNRDMNKIQELTYKYNFYNEYLNIRDLLDNLREQALMAGIDVGYIENYFPRQIDPKKKNEFISFLRANENGTYNDLLYNLEQLRNNKLFTTEDELRFINNFLRGFIPKDLILLSPNGNLKNPRTIEIITPEINEYFLPSNITLQNYIELTTKDIITREAFGIEDKEIQKLRNKLKEKHRQLKRVEETPAGKFKTNQEYKLAVNRAVKEKNLERFTAKKKNKTITPEEMEQLNNLEQEIKDIETQMENFKKLNDFAVKNYHIKQIKKDIEEIGKNLPSDKLENSIAKFINNLSDLDIEQTNILKKYIANIINPAPSTTSTKFFNNTAYGLALTSFRNALNQLPELAVSFYKNGFFNTLDTITKKHKITIEDLGIEDTVSGINKEGLDFINKILTLTGFNKIDMYGKNTFLNSTLLNTKRELKKNNKEVNKDIEQFMTKDAEKVKEDILNDKMSFEVKEYLVMKLAGVQPILMSARPYNYLNNGGLARMLYTLKIFSLKQLNMIHNDVIKKITSRDKKEAIEGLKNLVRYQVFLLLMGAPKDIIIGMATGYDDDDENIITDAMLDNILIFNIISRYTLAKVGTQGLGTATIDYFTPVLFRFANDTQKDIVKMIEGELEFEDVRTLKYVPFGKDIKMLKNIME